MARDFALLTPEGKGIIGSVDDEGVVTFAVEAGEGASIRGTELFDRMMHFFGAEVRALRGVWRKGRHGRPSTNIDKVNELTAAGVPLEVAVQQAWTVTRARRWGFTRITLLDEPVGMAGVYTQIDILIEKPVGN